MAKSIEDRENPILTRISEIEDACIEDCVPCESWLSGSSVTW